LKGYSYISPLRLNKLAAQTLGGEAVFWDASSLKVERTGKTTRHIEVLKDKCVGCSRCVEVCPAGCWKISEGKAFWEKVENCLECAACFFACPSEAIVWRYPEGGEGVVYRL